MHGPHAHQAAQDWFRRRTFSAGDAPDPVPGPTSAGRPTISVVLPALNEEDTIGEICDRIHSRLVLGGVVQQLLVIDSGSTDETAKRASAAGATVAHVGSIFPELPVASGKGEALWRGLAIATGDVVVYLDSDVRNFDESFVSRLAEPLLCDPGIDLVKGYYDRPLGADASIGGGRGTELVARPLLNLFYPALSGFRQPLAGEYAVRRELLLRVPFFCGYAVEIGLLIDIFETVGLDRMAQADLGARVHRNRPTVSLGAMAFEITKAVLSRVERDGGAKFESELTDRFAHFAGHTLQQAEVPLTERPPIAAYASASSGGGTGGATGSAL